MIFSRCLVILFGIVFILSFQQSNAADNTKDDFPIIFKYERPGFSISTKDGNWKTKIRWRFQFRSTYPYENTPRSASGFSTKQPTFNVRRSRIKVDGHGYRPWIKYKFEYDLPTSTLLDWRVTLTKFDWLQLRVGQFKVNYNRERVDSSGKQQFIDRSIVNRMFTVDRQTGVELLGHLFSGTFADSRYTVGVYTGMGLGRTNNDDNNLMYMGRFQWNFLGRDLKFSQSDVEYHKKPTGSIAFAASTDQSKCTRFSSSGCGNLDGYTNPDNAKSGQFNIKQIMGEFAFKYHGLSLQQEYHWKKIKDNVNDTKTNLMGAYTQVGYFPHYLIPIIPKPLETAFRYAYVDSNTSQSNDIRQEYTVALNWFFFGHNNKITVDVSHLTLGSNLADNRARLQWDITF